MSSCVATACRSLRLPPAAAISASGSVRHGGSSGSSAAIRQASRPSGSSSTSAEIQATEALAAQPLDQARQRRGLAEAGRRGDQDEAARQRRLRHALLEPLARDQAGAGSRRLDLGECEALRGRCQGASSEAYFAVTARPPRVRPARHNRRHDARCRRPAARGRMHVPCRALSPRQPAALRPLLPLHLVPARERRGVRAQRDDRVGARRAAERRARAGRHAVGERRRPADRALPALPRRGLEPLRRRRRRDPLRSRRHARRARRGCRPTSTSSRRRSSPGWCCRPARRRCAEYYDRKQYWPAESLARRDAMRAKAARKDAPPR